MPCATPSARLRRRVEKKARRDKAGRATRAKGGAPRIFLDAKKQRAENSGAREGRLADRLIGDRTDALEQARARVEILTPLSIELPKTGLPGSRELIAFNDVVMAHGTRRLFGPLSFEVRGPERIAVGGANGSGKTTLLRLIAGDLEPATGDVRRLTDRIAVLDQHVGLLDSAGSILDNLRRLNPELTDNEAHAALARFAFRNTAALRIAATLSGGERLRAGLACVFARREPPLLLLLDEPTNHLDLASIEVLETALAGFDGALIAVSHDQRFCGRSAWNGRSGCDHSACAAQTGARLPEIIDNEVNVGWRSEPAVQVRIDHPAAGFDGSVVAEIVGGFENEPGHIDRGEASGFGSAEAIPKRSREAVPNESALIADTPQPVSDR